jgi:hypothetical protein
VNNELERTWKGLVTSCTVPVLSWRHWGKSRKSRFRKSNHRTEICTHDCTTYILTKNMRLKTNHLKFSQHVESTPWCTVLLEKLIVAQFCKKYPSLCENRNSLTFLRLNLGFFCKWFLPYVFRLQFFVTCNPVKQQTRTYGEKCITHLARTKRRDLLYGVGSGIFACLLFVVMLTTLEASLCGPRYYQHL